MQANETKFQSYIEGTKQYVVPLFQRPYSWETSQWRNLWVDLLDLYGAEQSRPHFIGPVVAMPTASVPEGVPKYLLIDGQQRLTTLMVLLALLRDQAKVKGLQTLADEIQNTLLVNPYKKGADYLRLQPTQVDRPAFGALFGGNEHVDPAARIQRAYQFFAKQLRAANPDIERLKSIISTKLSLVSIVLDQADNPYLVFEGLNAKGMPLTQADLVRNHFIMRVHVDEQEDVHRLFWKPMEQRLGDSLTEFIRHYLMRGGSEVRENEVYFALKDEVAVGDIKVHLQQLNRYAADYDLFLHPEKEANTSLKHRLKRLRELSITICYPLLLNCFALREEGKITDEVLTDIVELVENFIVRRFVCGIPTYGLNKVFPPLFGQLDRENLCGSLATVLSTKGYPKDAEVRAKLPGTKLYVAGERAIRAKLILRALEESFAHHEVADLDKLTVEHVMPQTLTDVWRAELGPDYQSTHDILLHSIGNLTLTGYNPELSNASFATKQEILAKSHVQLNTYFADIGTWDREAIAIRGRKLTELALRVWPYFGTGGEEEEPSEVPPETAASTRDWTSEYATIQTRRGAMVGAFCETKAVTLELASPRARTLYRTRDDQVRGCFVVSKRYDQTDMDYWYAYHEEWDRFLGGGTESFYVAGTVDLPICFAIPFQVMHTNLAALHTTEEVNGRRYWHIKIKQLPNGDYHLKLPKSGGSVSLDGYRVEIKTSLA